MDGSGGYDLDVAFSPRLRLVVDFSAASYGRSPHPDAAVEAGVRARWAARLAANPAGLFNAPKFRYAGAALDPRTHVVTVRLGLTDYAEYQGTHGAPAALATFRRAGLSLPFGNSAVVETADGLLPFLVRSASVGEAAGAAVMPGGHAEPTEAGPPPLAELGNDVVAAEVWDAARREVLEELFVPQALLSPVEEMRMLGIVARKVDCKALIAFALTLRMTGAEVVDAYRRGNAKQEESVQIVLVAIDDLPRIHEAGRLPNGARISNDHLGGVELAIEYFKHKRRYGKGATLRPI
jgi:8-oxo-dGTP pyrophosphatase MutT (NUDIX family)